MNTFTENDIHDIVQRVIQSTNLPDRPGSSPQFFHQAKPSRDTNSNSQNGIVAVGSDHGGFELKNSVTAYLKEIGYSVKDCGTSSSQSVDYPDFAFAVADNVRRGIAWRGIVIDGAGIGSCMAANKVPGIRAAMCYDYATAFNSREHNDANVLTLGAGLLGLNQVKLIIKTWLETEFGGGRHARRVDKIMDIESKFPKEG